MISLPDLLLPKIKFFGLSIERTAIRAVELGAKGKILHLAEMTLPTDTFVDGALHKKSDVIPLLKELISKGKFTSSYVTVCFPEVFAYTREYKMPQVQIDELHEAIDWKAKDLFPFPREEIYYDWKLLKQTDKELHASIVAVQRTLLDSLLEVLVSAGLKPLRFEPDASALSRLVIIKPEEQSILIEINQHGSYVTITEGEKAVFTTVIPHINDQSSNDYVSQIDQTLREIVTFYREKGMLGENVTRVLVTGEQASNEWVTHLKSLLNYPTGVLKTPMQYSQYNKAYAAASHPITPPEDEKSINLLPSETQESFSNMRYMQYYKSLFIRAGIFLMLLTLMSGVMFGWMIFQKQQLAGAIETSRRSSASEQSTLQQALQILGSASQIVELDPLRKTPSQAISDLTNLLTPEIKISSFEYMDTRLQARISGTATTRENLLEFKEMMANSDSFSSITLPLKTYENAVQVPFVMTFNIQ